MGTFPWAVTIHIRIINKSIDRILRSRLSTLIAARVVLVTLLMGRRF